MSRKNCQIWNDKIITRRLFLKFLPKYYVSLAISTHFRFLLCYCWFWFFSSLQRFIHLLFKMNVILAKHKQQSRILFILDPNFRTSLCKATYFNCTNKSFLFLHLLQFLLSFCIFTYYFQSCTIIRPNRTGSGLMQSYQ